MRRRVTRATLVGAVGALALLMVASLPAPASADPWGMFVAQDHVQIGQPVGVEVFGPADAPFVLSLIPPPWNGTPPVFSQAFRTSNGTLGGDGVANLSLPTAPFGQSEYELQLNVYGAMINSTPVWLLPTYNDTYLNSSFQQFLQNWNVEQQIILNQREQIASQGQTIEVLEGTLFAAVLGAVLWEIHRWRLEHSPRYMRRSRSLWKTYAHGPPDHILPFNPKDADDLAAPPVPGAWFVGLWSDCRVKPWLEKSLVEHIRKEHSAAIGPAGPRLGRHYFVWPEEKRRVQRYYADPNVRPSMSQRLQKRPVDLREVLVDD